MHLLIFPFILVGLSSKLLSKRIKTDLPSSSPEKQIDLIIASFFTTLKPEYFGDLYHDDKQTVTPSQKRLTPTQNKSIS